MTAAAVNILTVLTAIHIVLLLAILVIIVRLFGWMAVAAPRAWWRGWAAENRGDKTNPYRFGTWDHAAWREGHDVSREIDPDR